MCFWKLFKLLIVIAVIGVIVYFVFFHKSGGQSAETTTNFILSLKDFKL